MAKKYKGQATELLGNNVSEQALVDQWCEVEGQSFNPPASTILFQTFVVPMKGGTTDEAVVEMNVEKVVKVLDIYEERLSKSKYFLQLGRPPISDYRLPGHSFRKAARFDIVEKTCEGLVGRHLLSPCVEESL